MKTTGPFLAALSLLLILGLGSSPDPAGTASATTLLPGAPAASGITVAPGTSAEQLGHVEWALARFERAGIRLPSLEIQFYASYEDCKMRQGLMRISNGSITVLQCEREAPDIRRSLLHELVHVWDLGTDLVKDDRRMRFMALRGVTAWNDPADEWPHQGVEQAAEVVAWGLMERPAPIPSRVGSTGPQDDSSLATAFTALTGVAPLWEHEASRIPSPGSRLRLATAPHPFLRSPARYTGRGYARRGLVSRRR
jgi:hypothetical protein